MEITDIVFTTVGPGRFAMPRCFSYNADATDLSLAAGAIVVEWNVRQPDGVQAATGMWDSHIRLGGGTSVSRTNSHAHSDGFSARGTELEGDRCPIDLKGPYDPCFAAFLSLHITKHATGYFEVRIVCVSFKKPLTFCAGDLGMVSGP